MNRIIKYLSIGILLNFLLLSNGVYADSNDKLNILFTHDLHDNLYPRKVLENDEIVYKGGYARIASKIEELKTETNTILIDGGDFSMGTLFQTVFTSESPTLALMGKMGYDVTTLGNHEFDFRPEGLYKGLLASKKNLGTPPNIVVSNMGFPFSITEDLEKLTTVSKSYPLQKYSILQEEDYKIGIIGLMGPDAVSNAPMAGVKFQDYIDSAQSVIDQLKKENVDIIIALSHSGTNPDKKKSEDEILARKIPDIDLIVSAHTHTELKEPIMVGKTAIVSAGSYGENLGQIVLSQDGGNWTIDQYTLHPIDESITEDKNIKRFIDFYRYQVEDNYLRKFGLKFNQVLARTDFNFVAFNEFGKELKEEPLANLIADSYIHAVKEAEADKYEPIAVSIVPNGIIRESITLGDITVSDIFNIIPLGIGPDKISGYPLIDVYLTGQELKTAAEVDGSITPIMDVAQLNMAGLQYTINPNRFIFDKVTSVNLLDENGQRIEIDNKKLYRVVTGLYSAQMLSVVGDKSKNLLSIVPKDKNGQAISNFEKQIIYTEDKRELKEWFALSSYVGSFPQVNGIATIPEYYKTNQERKIIDDDKSFIAKIKNPNKLYLKIYGGLVGIIILIGFILTKIIKASKIKKVAKDNIFEDE